MFEALDSLFTRQRLITVRIHINEISGALVLLNTFVSCTASYWSLGGSVFRLVEQGSILTNAIYPKQIKTYLNELVARLS